MNKCCAKGNVSMRKSKKKDSRSLDFNCHPPALATCPVTYDKSVAVISSRRNATQYWPRPSPSLSTASRFSDGFNVRLLPEREKREKERGTSVPLSTTMAIEQGGPVGPARNPSHQSTPINPDRLLPPHLLAPTPWARGKRCYRRSNAINQADDGRSLATRARAPNFFYFSFSLSLSQSLLLSLAFSLSYPPKAVAPSFPLPEVLKFPAQEKKTLEESNTTHAPHSLLCWSDGYLFYFPEFPSVH
ncbi:hypothetical protein AVEN_1173-1 [Araneus ventricosus]|uniref:Uncharacterized protein n=1 Tax=Araneus ventricosus TaxID=182803 RepID=A0A4Y2EES3_ARAVE|nr:hypothetical protein AVEN_1173-1 [Araneus ventricosus]